MKTAENIFIYITVMALVTYLIRMLPIVIFRKKIENRFIRSFLYYIPYAVLAAMTFPAVFFVYGERVVGCGRAHSGAAACVF